MSKEISRPWLPAELLQPSENPYSWHSRPCERPSRVCSHKPTLCKDLICSWSLDHNNEDNVTNYAVTKDRAFETQIWEESTVSTLFTTESENAATDMKMEGHGNSIYTVYWRQVAFMGDTVTWCHTAFYLHCWRVNLLSASTESWLTTWFLYPKGS